MSGKPVIPTAGKQFSGQLLADLFYDDQDTTLSKMATVLLPKGRYWAWI
jgi:hypothetical protein